MNSYLLKNHRSRAIYLIFCLRLKQLFFVSAVIFMFLGPMLNQVFQLRISYLRTWAMFSGNSRNVCKIRYTSINSKAEQVRLDRYGLLGFKKTLDAPLNFRLVRNLAQAENIGKQLCASLGPNPSVYLHAKCEKVFFGWNYVAKGDVNLCSKIS
jgi:hypothetical protein